MGRLENLGLLSMLAATGMSPFMVMDDTMKKHIRRDICIECLETIPDGRAGRRCKKCREKNERGPEQPV